VTGLHALSSATVNLAQSDCLSPIARPGTIDHARHWARAVLARRAALSKVPSGEALGRALEKAGHKRGPDDEAHHIVAGEAKLADPAREVLKKFEIGINEAANGVFLPSKFHRQMHSEKHYRSVNYALEQATTRDEALEALDTIRRSLK
jgi:A nuclease family of the HNH/ENDO VII superfamily with conserved AHH